MSPQQYRPSRRSWIKLWNNEWLDGTVRWQMNIAQRSIWCDLLCLAGYSRFPGVVTPGLSAGEGSDFIGYPMEHFVSIFQCHQDDIEKAFQLLETQGRITRDKGGAIHIVNWQKYQSEYQEKRQRRTYNEPHRSDSEYQNQNATKTKRGPAAFVLPEWIPTEQWAGFIEMRKSKRAPNTDRALRLAVSKLDKLRKQGSMPAEVLDQSTERGWTGLFPLRDERQNRRNGKLTGQQLLDHNLKVAGFANQKPADS